MLDWLRRGGTRSPQCSDADALPIVNVGDHRLPLVIRRLPHARRMTLRLVSTGGGDSAQVRVSMPRWGHSSDALAFARARADWLAEQLSRLPARQTIVPGGTVPYRGERLEIGHDPAHPRRPRVGEGALRLGGPTEGLDARLRRWLQAEAKALLAQDLAHYAALVSRPVPKLALSSARARWGSCSSSGIVRINWRLVLAPDWVRRSVVAHEVAHLVHFDHSPDFHALLAHMFEGDVAEANRWLKRDGRGLYAWFG